MVSWCDAEVVCSTHLKAGFSAVMEEQRRLQAIELLKSLSSVESAPWPGQNAPKIQLLSLELCKI